MKEGLVLIICFVITCLCVTTLITVPIVMNYNWKTELAKQGYVQQPVKYEMINGYIWVKGEK